MLDMNFFYDYYHELTLCLCNKPNAVMRYKLVEWFPSSKIDVLIAFENKFAYAC